MCSISPASGLACDKERFESSTQRGGVGCDERGAGADVAHELYSREEQPPQRFPAQMRWPPVLPAADRPVFADSNKLTSQLPQGCLRIHREDALIRVAVGVTRHASNAAVNGTITRAARAAYAISADEPSSQHSRVSIRRHSTKSVWYVSNWQPPQYPSAQDAASPPSTAPSHTRCAANAARRQTANAPGSAPHDRSGAWSTIRSTRSSAPLENLRCNYRSATRMAGLHGQVGCSPPTPVEPIWACQAWERR